MASAKTKQLLKHAAVVMGYYKPDNDSMIVEIISEYENFRDFVKLYFSGADEFKQEFLEAVCLYCIDKKVGWRIRSAGVDLLALDLF